MWRGLGHANEPIQKGEARSLGGHTEILKDLHFQPRISVSSQFNPVVLENSTAHGESPLVCLQGVLALVSHGC